MKRPLLLLLIIGMITCCFSSTKAQSFMHSAGLTWNLLNLTTSNTANSNQTTALFTNFTWFPRYILVSGDYNSLTVGMPLGAGIGIASSYYGASLYYGFDFPLVLDYNFGMKSTPGNFDKPGGYFGAGFGYTLTNWTDGGSSDHQNSYGPIFRGGIRFGAGERKHPDWGITIGLSYKLGLESAKNKTYGITVLWDF